MFVVERPEEENTQTGKQNSGHHHARSQRKTSQEEDRILERETGFEPATLALAIRKAMLLKGLIGAWFPHFSLISQHVSEILFSPVCLWRAGFL